ncbi:MAG: hypothetical protein FWD13_02970 [Treponema sp.]|nr:hypothetical protein [Treponema sp.]
MKKKYQSDILKVIHEDMKGMFQLGIIRDNKMREFDKMCTVEEPKPVYKTEENVSIKKDMVPVTG